MKVPSAAKAKKSVRSPASAAPSQTTSASAATRAINNLLWPLLTNARTWIITALLTGASALALAGWHAVKTNVDVYLAASISQQLNDENSVLYKSMSSAIKKMRKTEAGAVNAGSFVLTPSNPTYELFVYVPTEHYTAKLYYQLSENAFTKCQRVVLAFPNAKAVPLRVDGHSIDLEKFFQLMSPQAQAISDDIFVADEATKSLSKNLHAITFQLDSQLRSDAVLAGLDGSCPPTSQDVPLQISYVTLVAPSIHMGQ